MATVPRPLRVCVGGGYSGGTPRSVGGVSCNTSRFNFSNRSSSLAVSLVLTPYTYAHLIFGACQRTLYCAFASFQACFSACFTSGGMFAHRTLVPRSHRRSQGIPSCFAYRL